MKAAVLYEANQPLVIEDINARVSRAPAKCYSIPPMPDLCHSDLHFMEGLYPHPMPVVLGHESAGIVDQVGSEVSYVKPGDHVITCLSVFCGTCEQCTSGRPVALHEHRRQDAARVKAERLYAKDEKHVHTFVNLSSFAEQMLVHENAIVKIQDDMPLDKAALIGCGVITGFGAAVNTAAVRFGDTSR